MSQLRGYEVVAVKKDAAIAPGEIVVVDCPCPKGKSSSVEGRMPNRCPRFRSELHAEVINDSQYSWGSEMGGGVDKHHHRHQPAGRHVPCLCDLYRRELSTACRLS